MKNVQLKKRVIVRPHLFESILEITHFLSGTFFKDSRNLYPRHGLKGLCTSEKEKAKAEAKVTRKVQLPPSPQNPSHTEVNTGHAHQDLAQDHGIPFGNHMVDYILF